MSLSKLVAAAVQWADRIMRKIDGQTRVNRNGGIGLSCEDPTHPVLAQFALAGLQDEATFSL